MAFDDTVVPAIPKSVLDQIIPNGGETKLKPERRFDAAVQYHMHGGVKTMNQKRPGKTDLLDPINADMEPSSYQPSKAELELEFDVPGLSPGQLRERFMRPITSQGWAGEM